MKQKITILFLTLSILNFSQENTLFPTLEYSDLQKMKIDLPYVKWYGKDNSLLVFGSNHTSDFNDPQIKQIFKLILTHKPSVILYEGDGVSVEKTQKETVETYYEMGLAKFIADSLSIKAINIEPNTAQKYAVLKRKYETDDILIATLGLQITMMQYTNEDFEKVFPTMISDLEKEGLGLSANQKTLVYFYKLYKKKFGKPFSYENFDSRDIQSKYNRTVFNEINQEANKFRDQHIIHLTKSLLDNGEKVFLLVGGWHAIVCEPAFKIIGDK